MSDVSFLAATALLQAYRSRELSPVEAAQAALEQIDRYDTAVNAFCLVDPETTLAQARESERRWLRGAPAGLLDGVPVAIKDVFYTRGWPTLKGSRLTDADQPWDTDGPVVAALREAGSVLVGKTTTPEFGWKGVTDSPRHGITRNPWDPSRTAGGSSGGSSAALMLGMSALATGTDAGGSVRIPGSFCGHPALKATYGRIPHWPPSPYGTLAHPGPMARTVADLALMMQVMVRPDPRDWLASAPDGVDYRAAAATGAGTGLAGLRVAFSPDLGRVKVDSEVAAAVAAAVGKFADLGCTVEQLTPAFPDPLGVYEVLWNCSAAGVVRDCTPGQMELLDPGFRRIAADGLGYSAADYVEVSRLRAELGVAMGLFHQEWDLLLTPTVPIPAFEAGANVPQGWEDDRWPTWTPFTFPFNLTQQPAATVPCGHTAAGLPVGLQIVGPRHHDARVLQAAAAFEQIHPQPARPPMLQQPIPGPATP